MSATLSSVQLGEPRRRWQVARKRGQFPKPKNVGGKWRIWYRTDQAQLDGTIKRVQKCKTLGSVRAMTLRQAQKEALRILEPINEVQVGIVHSDKTMRQLITQWCKSVAPTLKHSTQESYAWAIKRVAPAFGHVPVAAVGGSDVQALLTAASGELSSISGRNLKMHLSGLLTAACEWGWILQNPARGRFRLPPKIPVQRRRVLSPEEFHRLVAALPQPYSTIVSLAGLSGLRAGELAALLWHHIEPGFVVVEQAVYRGKLGTPKSRHSAKRVPIGPMTEKALTEWRGIAPLTGPDDYVFGLRTNGPLDMHNTAARHLTSCQTSRHRLRLLARPRAHLLHVGP